MGPGGGKGTAGEGRTAGKSRSGSSRPGSRSPLVPWWARAATGGRRRTWSLWSWGSDPASALPSWGEPLFSASRSNLRCWPTSQCRGSRQTAILRTDTQGKPIPEDGPETTPGAGGPGNRSAGDRVTPRGGKPRTPVTTGEHPRVPRRHPFLHWGLTGSRIQVCAFFKNAFVSLFWAGLAAGPSWPRGFFPACSWAGATPWARCSGFLLQGRGSARTAVGGCGVRAQSRFCKSATAKRKQDLAGRTLFS